MRSKKDITDELRKILLELKFARDDEVKKTELERRREEIRKELKDLAFQEIKKQK